ncbi:uncharacterized protein LOC124304595 [Neodiprion virginianus]|uniref:uncharacterized protein LOC124304595 n=1 Tax=Neodiprion virginianus TaxID=2961670 RepID=UPI001EE71E74|nr:uncharacterized protein LOC124304595 [Neodiprion virginianus]
MAFNTIFLILTITSYALTMPVQVADDRHLAVAETSTQGDVSQDFAGLQEEGTTAIVGQEDSTIASTTLVPLVGQDLEKRSVEVVPKANEDLETAAGTNLLRPLFVYRQQVAYRQRIRNARRRGSRFF